MPISQNKLMPYSDNPSITEENNTEQRSARTPTRKKRGSSRFKPGQFFQRWFMSSRQLRFPGQQSVTHINLNRSINDSLRSPIRIRPVSLLYNKLDQHNILGDHWVQPNGPFSYRYPQKSMDIYT
ncbi:hypothetical protein PTTG_11852 [Puccinia triticina 1-1 BBBD Race 1]|uniref:Uncharacterized protein n=1 Tax=Puccinia triticina (isolate 1-1 / race 1 (BBBD)) TaxID=630390 RepID=A0A180GL06_PUCT1|nr:hypothetical protein PTTG_11852 [Puccinia triticina 1-1 BBBD Race 1]WAR55476.1 hypothetical protein PtB15_6B217 [Puccinia triticina]